VLCGQNVQIFKVTIRGTYRNHELLNNENTENIGGRKISAFLETPTYDIKLQKDVTIRIKRAVRLFYTCSTLVLHLQLIPEFLSIRSSKTIYFFQETFQSRVK